MNRRLTLLLGAAGLLAVIVAADYARRAFNDGGLEPVRRPAPDTVAAAETGPFLPDFSAFEAIDNRPLFSPERRPPAQPTQIIETTRPVESAARGEPAFLVTGTGTGPDGRGIAIIRDANQTERRYVGDVVQGWRIESIAPNAVVVTQGGERWSLPVGERDR